MGKKKISNYSLIFGLSLIINFLIGCSSESEAPEDENVVKTEYVIDQTNFPNPERGFYGQQLSGSASPTPLSSFYLDQLKNKGITLVRRLYSMTTFRSEPISAEFLQHIQSDMDMLRDSGFKIILRFSYTFNEPEPHNDAPLNVVLLHIDQLEPILQKNADVIALMEAGFIGRWGEWHTSSNGLANTNDMRTILFKLLDALPKSRTVAVRYQQAKKEIYGIETPIGPSVAFDQSNRSRTAHHNDCFVASVDDWGTYWPIDETSLAAQKAYLNQENKYLPQEGETCNCNPPGSDCTHTMEELEKMRWSALNKDYIECVLTSWVEQGCYDNIAKRLGYRFQLIQSEIPKAVRIDTSLSFNFILRNDGFATPYNARDLELVLRSKTTKSTNRIKIDADPRLWLPDDGDIKLNIVVKLPSYLAPGEYDVLLNLPDPEPALNGNPAYSIRFANMEVWEPTTGYNSLLASISVTE